MPLWSPLKVEYALRRLMCEPAIPRVEGACMTNKPRAPHTTYLGIVVFVGGLVSLGIELAASRLLAPFFGTSQLVWMNLIGLILLYLSAGYWLGGRWVDRSPHLTTLLLILVAAGVSVALVPVLATPLLHNVQTWLVNYESAWLIGSFLGVLLLFALPMTLLGCVSPFAVRLATADVRESGRVAGRLFALSTIGSFLGTFLPVLVLIPLMGTRATFFTFSAALFAVTLPGFWLVRRRLLIAVPLAGMVLVGWLWWTMQGAPIKPHVNLLYETESAYQYIRVLEDADGMRYLELNEGVGTHSIYHPERLFTQRLWDYFVALPAFAAQPKPLDESRSWGIIGLAGGTAARLITATYGPDPITGVELDPKVVDVARTYFAMNMPNLDVVVLDGRAWLAQTPNTYDLLIVDAYRQPYIPFELTTVEFFQAARRHLTPDGVIAVNVAHGEDERLVDALAATMQTVFPTVYRMPVPHTYNTFIIGTVRPTTPEQVSANSAMFAPLLPAHLVQWVQQARLAPHTNAQVLTDDHAPVEYLVDWLIVREGVRLNR
ncbi:MAG: spermine synthase [Ardenticatenia bacterium]|nr:MAG: spermine synthase [Ardenticatenia bacterium]